MGEGKRPSFQFYPNDWLSSTDLQVCSLAAQGLWMRMICFMHRGSPYGHLRVNGRVITDQQLSLMMGGDAGVIESALRELEAAGVFSRGEDGVIYSRRMVRDEAFRQVRAACGKAGGSPVLREEYNGPGFVYAMLRHNDGQVKIGASTNPNQRLYAIRQQLGKNGVTLLGKKYVDDMGAEEKRIHQAFEGKGTGEWFRLTGEEITILMRDHLGVMEGVTGGVISKLSSKVSRPPSSSSSSSSSNKEIREEGGNHDHHNHPQGDAMPGDTVFLTGYSSDFEAFWNAYPRRAKKQAAWGEYQAAVAYLVGSEGMTDQRAHEFLQAAAKEYASSEAGRTGGEFRPHPDTWLKDHRFEDDRAEWSSSSESSVGKPKAFPLTAKKPRGVM